MLTPELKQAAIEAAEIIIAMEEEKQIQNSVKIEDRTGGLRTNGEFMADVMGDLAPTQKEPDEEVKEKSF